MTARSSSGDDPAVDRRIRLAFGTESELYERARPSYPVEAARWLLGDEPLRVAELAAGTGLFTRVLVGLGHEVIAIEPDEGMRREFRLRVPGVEVVAGQAESIPLEDASVDVVVAAQAHWWFDPVTSSEEFVRVLRPGGRFAAIWNAEDQDVEWVRELCAVGRQLASMPSEPPLPLDERFSPAERVTFRHVDRQTAEGLVDVIRSRAFFIAAADDAKADVVERVRAIAARLPAIFDLPYVAYAARAALREA